jgi:hypothetical protein
MNEIKDESAKKFLLKAEASMEQQKYREVIVYATAGLEVMFIKANKLFFNESSFNPSPFDKSREIQNLENLLNETVICYSLDIDIKKYVRYRKMVGYFRIVGEESIQKGGMFSRIDSDFDEKDAGISLTYCKKTIIEIEETLEQLNKPLNEE